MYVLSVTLQKPTDNKIFDFGLAQIYQKTRSILRRFDKKQGLVKATKQEDC